MKGAVEDVGSWEFYLQGECSCLQLPATNLGNGWCTKQATCSCQSIISARTCSSYLPTVHRIGKGHACAALTRADWPQSSICALNGVRLRDRSSHLPAVHQDLAALAAQPSKARAFYDF